MVNRFRGFGRMLSTAKNTTRKEGFGRMFSSESKNSTQNQKEAAAPIDYVSERMKELYGDNYRTLTYAQRKEIITRRANKRVDREMIKAISAGAAVGLALSAIHSCILFEWYL